LGFGTAGTKYVIAKLAPFLHFEYAKVVDETTLAFGIG
jgi:hypothetical protein